MAKKQKQPTKTCADCKHDMGRCLVPAKNEAFKKWLKQPAEDATNENISNPQSGDAHKN